MYEAPYSDWYCKGFTLHIEQMVGLLISLPCLIVINIFVYTVNHLRHCDRILAIVFSEENDFWII